MHTIRSILKKSQDFLEKRKVSFLKRDIEDLIAFYLKVKRIELYMDIDRPIEEKELSFIREGVKKMAENDPLEYITGYSDFSGLKLLITKDVLIPRPETEILVEKIIQEVSLNKELKGKTFLDIGTGSGAIGLSVKKAFPDLRVILTDQSEKALKVARKNAQSNKLDVEYFLGDLLDPLPKGERVDFLASNPPYISEKAYQSLERSVKKEPFQALVGGKTGLEIYERLEKESRIYLKKQAKCFFEIGFDQKKSLLSLFSDPFWKKKEIYNDWSGHSRFFFLEIE